MTTGVDPEIGVSKQETFLADDRLQPIIQQILDSDSDGDVVGTVLIEAFYACLLSAGATPWQIEKWRKRTVNDIGRSSLLPVQDAYEPLGAELTCMINDGVDPLAAAWACTGCDRQLVYPGCRINTDPRLDKLMEKLIFQIEQVRRK